MEVLLQDCTGRACYQTVRRLFYFRICGQLHIFYYKTVRGHTTRLYGGFEFGGFWPLFDYQTARGANTLMKAAFFLSKKFLFNNITHLLHSGIQCDLDHSCCILHKSHDGFWYFFRLPEYTGAHYQTTRWLRIWGGFCQFFWLPDCTGATTLMMAAFVPVEKLSFLVI